MKSTQSSTRRTPAAAPRAECLETRTLLTGGAGNTFALVSGTIAEAGKPAVTAFTLDAEHFTLPRRSITLGIDVAPVGGSTAKPYITAVEDTLGKREIGTIRSFYAPEVGATKAGTLASAVLVKLTPKGWNAKNPPPASYEVEVDGDKTTGGYLVGFYLPGDVDGDGVVRNDDLKAIRSANGSAAGQAGYNFNADANRDGRITGVDLNLAQNNKGILTTVQPLIMASLDPASDSGTANRETVFQNVIFNGTATPGAKITYKEVGSKTAEKSVVTGRDGTYSVVIPLAEGENVFQVTSTDGFGQTISGKIEPVKYTPPLVPVTSPTTPKEPPKSVVPKTDAQLAREKQEERQKEAAEAAKKAKEQQVKAREDQAAKLREKLAARQDPA
jgi:hypothetical protein